MYFYDSKFGGIPYLPVGMEYPKNKKGAPLRLLAQINCMQLPRFENFPADGLIQFYIDSLDDCYGANFDTYENDGGYCVQYIPYNGRDYLETQKIDVPVESEYFPIEIPHKLDMSLGNMPIPVDNPSFEDYFAKEIDENINSDIDFWEIYESLIEKPSEHRIGGYPSFVQHEPYFISESPEEYTLLLQIGYEKYICFGDAGIASFFIKTEDLKKRDFSNVLFEWACS